MKNRSSILKFNALCEYRQSFSDRQGQPPSACLAFPLTPSLPGRILAQNWLKNRDLSHRGISRSSVPSSLLFNFLFDMFQVNIQGLFIDRKTGEFLALLKEEEGDRTLPIWIQFNEMLAMAKELSENALRSPRPLTHDLARDMISVYLYYIDECPAQ